MPRFAPSLFIVTALTLAACSMSPDSVALKHGDGNLHFTRAADGFDRVEICHAGTCSKAPDNEYKTAHNLTVPVVNGKIHYVEFPHRYCNFAPIGDKEHLACKDIK